MIVNFLNKTEVSKPVRDEMQRVMEKALEVLKQKEVCIPSDI